MTLQELSAKYNISESSIKNNFLRVQKSIEKKYHVHIEKEGRGIHAAYYEAPYSDNRAISMFNEPKEELIFSNAAMQFMNIELCCFLAIIATPMFVFRGSYKDFCDYIEINSSKENIDAVKTALENLKNKLYIQYVIDITDEDYFLAALLRKTEVDMKINIQMVRICKSIAETNNKRSWIPLLKTWIGIQIAANNQPFTMEDLRQITGLSDYQIREAKKLLEQNEIFKTTKAYISYNACIGSNVELNSFFN